MVDIISDPEVQSVFTSLAQKEEDEHSGAVTVNIEAEEQ